MKNGNGKHPKRPLAVYTTYKFRRYDPVIDAVCERLDGHKLSELKALSNVSTSTMRNWQRRKTRRPQHATLAAALGAVGSHFEVVDDD